MSNPTVTITALLFFIQKCEFYITRDPGKLLWGDKNTSTISRSKTVYLHPPLQVCKPLQTGNFIEDLT